MTDFLPAPRGPSDKELKYDRQLRLWAAAGQAALESANVLLVNSSSGTVGVEALKNLVLPGIGRFTIADAAVVEDADLGVNFFLDESCVGKSRAECCAQYLQELNPDVSGEWHPKAQAPLDLARILDGSHIFTTIIYTLPLSSEHVGVIEAYAHRHAAPLVPVHSVGFYSYFRIDLPSAFPVVDTHPDETATTDLRLLNPWSELSSFAQSMTRDIDGLDDHEHGHLPLVVILLHYLATWKQEHHDRYPTTYADKLAFRALVSRGMRRNNAEGGEENFEEAISAVMKHVASPSLPSSLQQIFKYYRDGEATCSSFWIIIEAVHEFYRRHQQLPVSGGLPDMKAQSSVYLKLQSIYKEKARRDVGEVLAIVQSMPGGNQVDIAEVELLCANARFIKLINTPDDDSLNMQLVAERELSNDRIAAMAGPEVPTSLMPIYLALTAMSQVSTMSAEDIMASIANRAPAFADSEKATQIASEVARAAGGELHNISAATGGMVAQEVIKIITRQYIPIDNTCIFDGIESRCQVLRL